MDDIQKMFQMLVNGQSTMRGDLLARIDKLDKKLSDRMDGLDKKMDKGFKGVNDRIDKLGKSLAYLEDDAPTSDEFDNLEVKVAKIEQILAVA
ncbi:hypothetical protein CO009_02540 [Candidatus Shapirobacteria bacterium CG_4_8_14_3_um_filter_35_11]|uniref:Uncharacterized protein n=6 Tax=Candidatus Shapironibacteriota TaxID=1752721 RepID=A0A1J5I2M8_9BACT|nr:MAG: hypothetical protein AUK05_01420 [Candidatus Shapirobacteria bacterium CG2_30_35_20]PIV07506.1 MAG: hypothetical protein COS53_02050 [Candidatus Shapirobacteria bacterium CG03_land_8_20_14_0_80_35_14]PIX68260.1 MAG: hypothetical protein COZ41_00635 [Candidatus Shapirobacteria bacterium CG_4_10_14_3_um_filter_35_13]PJA50749.1 MAG: hypothetical protein CO168_03380 [Candidatus Shapirobacteria bacterium CG_4_9_14_3_um_filter_36_12]PJC80216.1 MAG: hypothetical protein CO009_02540 [Candidatus